MFGLSDGYAYKVDMLTRHGDGMQDELITILNNMSQDNDMYRVIEGLIESWDWAKAINPYEKDS